MTTGTVKPWHIVVIVAAVVVAGASISFVLRRGDSVHLANEVMMVDITTGELFRVSLSSRKAVGIPDRNPETSKFTLLPVRKNDSGVWTVSGRDLGALSLVEGEPKALVDRKTGEVRVTSETAKRVK